jgi:hypothetical protein
MCCAGQALEADFTGVIRQQDVRSHEVDKVCPAVLGLWERVLEMGKMC